MAAARRRVNASGRRVIRPAVRLRPAGTESPHGEQPQQREGRQENRKGKDGARRKERTNDSYLTREVRIKTAMSSKHCGKRCSACMQRALRRARARARRNGCVRRGRCAPDLPLGTTVLESWASQVQQPQLAAQLLVHLLCRRSAGRPPNAGELSRSSCVARALVPW
eukprot:6094152-Pleurochrysis_carterae.AAC.2